MTIDQWLKNASNELADAMVPSARLDAEIILAHTIGHPRTWLHAHGDEDIDARHMEIANARIDLRIDHTPIAYIIGHKDFFGRRFHVNPNTLIPRPESEQIVDLLLEALPENEPRRLVDVGTGSGCLAITLKLERPQLDVVAIDTSLTALSLAEENSKRLSADVRFLEGDLLKSYPFAPDIVVANLPYVDKAWDRSPETRYEPDEALFADDHGMGLIKSLVTESAAHQPEHGLLCIEADPRQWNDLKSFITKQGYQLLSTRDFANCFIKL